MHSLAIDRFSPGSVTVLAGPGGNGGGGLAGARHLANRGCQVQVVLSEPGRLTPVPAHQARPGAASALSGATIAGGADVGATGAFSPVVHGRRLHFRPTAGGFRDRETGSHWSVLGHADAGPLTGQNLTPVTHEDTFWLCGRLSAPTPGSSPDYANSPRRSRRHTVQGLYFAYISKSPSSLKESHHLHCRRGSGQAAVRLGRGAQLWRDDCMA